MYYIQVACATGNRKTSRKRPSGATLSVIFRRKWWMVTYGSSRSRLKTETGEGGGVGLLKRERSHFSFFFVSSS